MAAVVLYHDNTWEVDDPSDETTTVQAAAYWSHCFGVPHPLFLGHGLRSVPIQWTQPEALEIMKVDFGEEEHDTNELKLVTRNVGGCCWLGRFVLGTVSDML